MFQAQRSPGMNENNKTWIVVANRTHARFFASDGAIKNFHLVETEQDPDGNVQELATQGDSLPSPHRNFAKTIGTKLNRARAEHTFVKLILIAESRLLGEIRAQLDGLTTECVNVSVDKDLTHLNYRSLESRLHDLLIFN